MKLLKNALIGFGVLFVTVIGLLIFAGIGSSDFREQQAPIIESFMHEFAQSWDVSAVHSKLSNDLLKGIDTPPGRNALGVTLVQETVDLIRLAHRFVLRN